MPLDPHARRFLEMIAAGGMSQLTPISADALRGSMHRLIRAVDLPGVSLAGMETREVPRCGNPLPVRIYSPDPADRASAALLYFHGGAGVFCSIETHDGICRSLAEASGARVVSIGYRLAPEHRFPAALEDAGFAAEWLWENAPGLGIARSRIGVAGDSAGGTLAAALCQLGRNGDGPRFALQLLLCPVLDALAETASRRAYGEGYFVTNALMDWAMGQVCPREVDRRDQRLSPLRAADLSGLPPTHIHTAEFDPLRDEGEAYAERLRQAGVAVQYRCHAGMIHHFYGMAAAIPYARPALREAGAAVRDALA
jgi:acetyl esterase/lipase